MRKICVSVTLAVIIIAVCAVSSQAWDVLYDGSIMPTDSSLGSAVWQGDSNNNLDVSSCQSGILHLISDSTATARFYREGYMNLPSGTNVTMEARVKVNSSMQPFGSDYYSAVGFGVSTAGTGGQYVRMWSDRIGVMYANSNYPTFYYLDMTEYHTIRLNLDASNRTFDVWVDGNSVFSGSSPGGNNWGGIQFGSDSFTEATSDSYWDYVAYTVPEPSSFLVLLWGLGGVGGIVLKRRTA